MISYVPFIVVLVFCVFHAQAENYTEEIREEELPSKVQQRNLIDTGRELCGLIRDVVSNEARESESAVQKDVEMMISRAREIISLKQENFELKHGSLTRKDIKSRAVLKTLPKLREEADASLTECQSMVADQTSIIANRIVEDAFGLEQKGQDIMNEFFECSKKGSWSMFSCYKKTIGAKIFPLKDFLMDTVRAHSRAHTDFLTARNSAANCIDKQLKEYENKIESMYNSLG
ncbi:uncharacterized protein LOC123680617 [Harmonia axyridis]|uniref:uncharacterized protein LOC123680617 n=1 Tax=Harmonia axyridis TaxID=115357 RepID=UPI001E27999F|nr:uncharacterized protein LOC123680617 [Harmonia axyridis]